MESEHPRGPIRPAEPYPDMLWSAWGDPARATKLSEERMELLRTALGVPADGLARVELDEVRLPEPRLAPAAREALARVVGEGNLRDDHRIRVQHTRGKSTPDLLLIRSGRGEDAPDAVVLPGSHEEVAAVLAVCDEHRVAVVPFGGGTSVVGGLTADREGFTGVIALDLRRLNRLLEVDEISRTATLEPGLRGPEAERLLGERGFTIGHFPQSFNYATLGGFAAARSSGQASAGYGRFDERVVRLKVATPRGTLELGRAPKSAAGPDLRQLVLGSEGAFGVITALTVELAPAPAARRYDGWRLPSFSEGATALRRLAQDGPRPTVLRLSDEVETALNLARPTAADVDATGGCLAISGYEGEPDEVAARREAASAVLRACGGELDDEAGASWAEGRYEGPYLRDALLDAGAVVETLETVTFWSNVPKLYEAVRAALTDSLSTEGRSPVVMCHISHVYPSGASLYFTVAVGASADPLAQWGEAKRAACDAILAAGGSISHHHGVGRDHREHLAEEIGPLGVAALAAVKRAWDPNGILNPGILIG